MRHNNRKTLAAFPVPDILIQNNTLNSLENIVLKQNKDGIKDTIYKGKYQRNHKIYYAVRDLLCEIYFYKCAYCEDIENKPEVEHYRPKKGVIEASNHSGYYWLCYEWTNLLPSCRYCNTEGGKGNKFPIQGLRVKFPTIRYNILDKTANHATNSPLIDEQPYLLHPEIDFPDNKTYFKFKNTGEIIGIDNLGRGEATIKICNLNRKNLLTKRLNLVRNEVLRNIHIALKLHFAKKVRNLLALKKLLELIFTAFKERCDVSEPFSLFAIYIYDNFDEIITPLISDIPQRAVVAIIFSNFKIENPLN